MFWSQYRSAIVRAVPFGASVGAFLGLAVYLSGNPDYRAQGGWGAFGYWLALGAILGGVTALAALTGGALVIALTTKFSSRAKRVRALAGSLGAAGGAGIFWLILGVTSTAASPTGSSWVALSTVAALVAAIVSLFSASLLLRRSERRASSTRETKPR